MTDYELNMELNQVYEQLADIGKRQQELQRERTKVELVRDEILRELGHIGVRNYDVT